MKRDEPKPCIVITEEFLDLMRVFAMAQSCLEDSVASAKFQQDVLEGSGTGSMEEDEVMDPADICLCCHTREEHFGHGCSRVNCSCEQFVLIDFAPALLTALESLLPYLPDRNDAKNYAATNEGRAGTIHVAALRARELVHRAKNS